MGNDKNRRYSRKTKFKGNRYTSNVLKDNNKNFVVTTASELKLQNYSEVDFPGDVPISNNELKNVIFNLDILSDAISTLCCPVCFTSGVTLVEESVFGLASNMSLKCENCDFKNSFCTSEKVNKMHNINSAFVFGLRLIGKGYSAARKLCSAIDINALSNSAFRYHEKKIECAAEKNANIAMNEAASEIRKNNTDIIKCGVSVDGTWQRRGHSSLNGCVTAISIDSGKVLDVEVMSKMCRKCTAIDKENHSSKCKKHIGSSGAMEPVGAYRIFERSVQMRKLQYVDFYGDGDSKGYDAVKDMYGEKSVTKYECIGHIQKRVGSRLRKLKTKRKGLGGKGKLTDVFIDKLQNYYGIAIRSNANNLQRMQSAVIAAFYHCCSNAKQPMHGQCPVGPNSWCKFQRASSNKSKYIDKSKGLPKHIMNIIKPDYMKLCDKKLLCKCLHGKTQNANESFNGVLWKFISKDVFVEYQTLRLGAFMAVIHFNKGFLGLLEILNVMGVFPSANTYRAFAKLDRERIRESQRHSLPNVKIARKKNKMIKKGKLSIMEKEEGLTYKCGEF